MKNDRKDNKKYPRIPDLMFQNVKIPEALAPTPINPALDEANQLNIPRNPGPSLHELDWDVPDEPLATEGKIHATPNPHTDPRRNRKNKS